MDRTTIRNEFLEIECLTHSLRISALKPVGKTNLLADLSGLPPIPTPHGDFHFHGGHRLWHAPEAMPRTYAPDTGALTITRQPGGVTLETQTEPGSGIRKRIEIILSPGQPSVSLAHTLINDGAWPVKLAPWAITQFRLGGTVVLPMPVGNADPDGLLPNRALSFWPYARINDPRLVLRDDYILFHAGPDSPFKMGYFNPHGWMAYFLDGVLFRKTFDATPGCEYPDHNSNSEIYCNERFVELESLGPLGILQPGAGVMHRETWEITTGLDALPLAAQRLAGAADH